MVDFDRNHWKSLGKDKLQLRVKLLSLLQEVIMQLVAYHVIMFISVTAK